MCFEFAHCPIARGAIFKQTGNSPDSDIVLLTSAFQTCKYRDFFCQILFAQLKYRGLFWRTSPKLEIITLPTDYYTNLWLFVVRVCYCINTMPMAFFSTVTGFSCTLTMIDNL